MNAYSQIAQTLIYFGERNKKSYCFPSQAKILQCLETIYRTKISRRKLNYDLKEMEAMEMIERKKRHTKGINGQIECHSTLYILQRAIWRFVKKSTRWMKKLVSSGVQEMHNIISYNKKDDHIEFLSNFGVEQARALIARLEEKR